MRQYTLTEAADFLQVSPRKLQQHAREGRLPFSLYLEGLYEPATWARAAMLADRWSVIHFSELDLQVWHHRAPEPRGRPRKGVSTVGQPKIPLTSDLTPLVQQYADSSGMTLGDAARRLIRAGYESMGLA